MSFGFVPWALGALGLVGIAGVLYALQRLRVRHRQVEVETTLFWQQAIEESRARVLTQRFRHPWTYALLLVICSLLWLSFAGLQRDGAGERRHLVLLDGSAGMAHGQRFARAVSAAADYAAGLPKDRRTVLLCSSRAETVLRPGESSLLLRRRLEGAAPAPAPNSVVDVLFDVLRSRSAVATTVCVVGDLPLRPRERALLPASVELRRLEVSPRSGDNVGVTGLGVRPSSSGPWDSVDVLVEVRAAAGSRSAASPPAVSVGGQPWTRPPVAEPLEGGRRYRFAGIPAKGQVLEVALRGQDALALDDVASFALPDRTPVAVMIGPSVPEVVQRAVAADPGLVVGVDGARVVVRRAGATFGGDLPALELSDPGEVEDAFLIVHADDRDSAEVLNELYTGLGLDEIDAMTAAATLGRNVTLGTTPGDRRGLKVWRRLLEPDYDFVRSRAYPLFLGLGLRWLAEVEEGPVRVAVGEPVDVDDAEVTAGVVGARSFGAAFVPRAPGVLSLSAGDNLRASLLDPVATGASLQGAVDVPAVAAGSGAGLDLVTVFLLLALLLLAAEWVWFRTSRIP